MIQIPQDPQIVFDIVVEHALRQNCRSASLDNSNDCMYRGPNGTKCFAGVLIPDDKYFPSLEKISWLGLVNRNIAENFNKTFISGLQFIHDTFPVKEWPEKLRELGKEKGLNVDKLPPAE
jgi:hypothetical protein